MYHIRIAPFPIDLEEIGIPLSTVCGLLDGLSHHKSIKRIKMCERRLLAAIKSRGMTLDSDIFVVPKAGFPFLHVLAKTESGAVKTLITWDYLVDLPKSISDMVK